MWVQVSKSAQWTPERLGHGTVGYTAMRAGHSAFQGRGGGWGGF